MAEEVDDSNSQQKKCFDLFDTDQDNKLSITEFRTAVRAMCSTGGFATDEELDEAIGIGGGGDNTCTRPDFLKIMEARVKAFTASGGACVRTNPRARSHTHTHTHTHTVFHPSSLKSSQQTKLSFESNQSSNHECLPLSILRYGAQI